MRHAIKILTYLLSEREDLREMTLRLLETLLGTHIKHSEGSPKCHEPHYESHYPEARLYRYVPDLVFVLKPLNIFLSLLPSGATWDGKQFNFLSQ